ncbi:hypothetical protein HU200_003953 [Digitaria exilis]|uniref:Longin domain-containing protein n=1 Tax=Digitaria exilis TaxID=1010633 RepID=A0A835FX11_9POAL|nr:hypothetical protein HU200_003953 [Digitaria exilis]
MIRSQSSESPTPTQLSQFGFGRQRPLPSSPSQPNHTPPRRAQHNNSSPVHARAGLAPTRQLNNGIPPAHLTGTQPASQLGVSCVSSRPSRAQPVLLFPPLPPRVHTAEERRRPPTRRREGSGPVLGVRAARGEGDPLRAGGARHGGAGGAQRGGTNAGAVARQVLERLPAGGADSHVSYTQDRYVFHAKRNRRHHRALHGRRSRPGDGFLLHFWKIFMEDLSKTYGRAALTALAYAMNDEFSRVLKPTNGLLFKMTLMR